MEAPPRLRAVEAFPVDHEGQRFVALRDAAGYTPSVLMLPVQLLELLALLDGQHSLVDIQAEIMRRHGELLTREQVERLLEALDEHGFLDSARFAARRAAIDRAFLETPVRPASHAGGAYPAEPEPLRRAIDGFFSPPEGPGPVTAGPGATPLRGLVAPHIDYHRGGAAYAWAYGDAAARADADVFVVFGTCHAGMRDPFALTRKGYETPLGVAAVDRELVEAIAARAGQDCFGSELAHRSEHSIELQAVFLQYLYAGRREVQIVPILTSFVHEALARRARPEDDPRVPRFLDALADAVAATGRRVAFIAAADLAHMGPRFGDPAPVDAAELARIDREDRALLATVEAGDAGAFFDAVAADNDRRRTCGLSPIWTLLHAVGGAPGRLRRYAQWPDPQGVVTFASVVF